MVTSKVGPLPTGTPIVDEQGRPTPFFLRQWLESRNVSVTVGDVELSLTELQAAVSQLDEDTQTLLARQIIAGVGLDGGGTLGAGDVTLDLAAVLDDLTDVDTTTTPPTAGQALAFDAANSLWKPTTISGGDGGGFAYGNLGASTSSGSGFASKGWWFNPLAETAIKGLVSFAAEVSGASYKAVIAEINGMSLGPILASTSIITADTTVARTRLFTFSTPVTLNAGTEYACLHVRTDATTTTSSGLNFSDVEAFPIAFNSGFGSARLASTDPLEGQALDTKSTGKDPFTLAPIYSINL